jgi:hypothetical protein
MQEIGGVWDIVDLLELTNHLHEAQSNLALCLHNASFFLEDGGESVQVGELHCFAEAAVQPPSTSLTLVVAVC